MVVVVVRGWGGGAGGGVSGSTAGWPVASCLSMLASGLVCHRHQHRRVGVWRRCAGVVVFFFLFFGRGWLGGRSSDADVRRMGAWGGR